MEDVKWMALVISTITAGITYFNKKQNKGESLQEEYFNKILLEYFKVKHINPEFDTIKYINSYRFKNCYIPNYVFYLADSRTNRITDEFDNKELLEHILKVDYWINYPNMYNDVDKMFNKINKTIRFIEEVISIIIPVLFLFLAFSLAVLLLMKITSSFLNNDLINMNMLLRNFGLYGFILLSMCWISKLFGAITERSGSTLNEYTSDEKSIMNIIKKKERIFNEIKDKNYL
ncbi:hypothetical protein ACTFIN_17140 [Clostridium cagae]|uniref:hypothetical protein n=1 Tax=Clostridium cagae TaxID=2080751 RepID=UPI003F772C56